MVKVLIHKWKTGSLHGSQSSRNNGGQRIANEIDEKAFVSIINVHEAIGEGFTYAKPSKQRRFN